MKTARMLAATAMAVTLVLTASCSTKEKDPAEAALRAKIESIIGEGAKVSLYTFELIDSTTYGQELEFRIGMIETRLAQNEKLIEKYKRENKPNNAKAKIEAASKDRVVLDGLKSLRDSIADISDDVAYYDYAFSGKASGKEKTMDFPKAYASITPNWEVLSMDTETKLLHKALGRVIPGYLEIIGADVE